MMQPFEGIARITSTVATKSAMNPTLILAAIVVPLALLLGFNLHGEAQRFLFGLAGIVVTVALLQIVGFSIFSPNHLQDNRHVEEKLRIEHSSRLGDASQEIVIDADAMPINNPSIEDRRDV
ncbi:MAG: hypothetical protein ABWX67_10820 [Allosphingosinicella sp.]